MSIDPSCTPADITYPTVLKLLNEARESTERIIDDPASRVQIYANIDPDMTAARYVPISSELPNRKSRVVAR